MLKLRQDSIVIIVLLLLNCFFACKKNDKRNIEEFTTKGFVLGKDSIIQVYYHDSIISLEISRENTLIKIVSKDDSITQNYYREYTSLRNMGVEIYGHNCSICHQWYPDTKKEFDYSKVDSLYLIRMFSAKPIHKNLTLSKIEIITIGSYLKIMNKGAMYSSQLSVE
jgi:hypothetical protein